MLRFRIGSIPVEVRPSHLLIAGLLAWSWMPSAATRAPDALPALVAGAVAVFISILVHELGHAVAARAYGYQPEIVIEWFGGHTTPNAAGPIPWLRDVILTLAGPGFGLGLGALAVAALVFTGTTGAIRDPDAPLYVEVLGFFAVANILWAVLNLVPVLPLDGGRISNAIFVRVFGPRGVLGSQGLSLAISVAAVAWAVSTQNFILAIFFTMWGIRAAQIVFAVLKGDVPSETPHPSELAFAQAATLFQQKRLADAREVALRALEGEPPPRTRSRLHHLLGWIEVKDGDGPAALTHFGQTVGEVEPFALAAAYSLAGQDEQSLPLWERAWLTTKDPTVLHEWAGALVRLGRSDDARLLRNVDMRQALRAAERVLSIRGDHLAAARLGEVTLSEFPAPEVAYDAACAFARAGQLDAAQSMLDRAAELGFRDAAHARTDSDLTPLHPTPEFREWVRRLESARS